MDRKDFLKKGMLGLGTIVAIPTVLSSCNDKQDPPIVDEEACLVSPVESKGPFGNKTPADLVRENIIGDRTGVPLLVRIIVEDVNNNCEPLVGVLVDLWQCDAHGNYSQYSGQLEGNFTNEEFLRGRQTTDANGMASFISIYPGWYPGRAPHLHVEVLRSSGESLLVTQTAFPEDISTSVYATEGYVGDFDTSNEADGLFGSSLNQNLATSVSGDTTNGYTLMETIKVSA